MNSECILKLFHGIWKITCCQERCKCKSRVYTQWHSVRSTCYINLYEASLLKPEHEKFAKAIYFSPLHVSFLQLHANQRGTTIIHFRRPSLGKYWQTRNIDIIAKSTSLKNRAICRRAHGRIRTGPTLWRRQRNLKGKRQRHWATRRCSLSMIHE